MLADSPIMAFAPTTKPEEARDFYANKLGLRLAGEDPLALAFDCNGILLRVQKVQMLVPAQHTILGWQVADIEAAVADLQARGVVFQKYDFAQDERGIWTSPSGSRVAWFKDPDGNILSISQHP